MPEVYTQADLDRATRVARAHAGGQYLWGRCKREGSDCSGFMSILYNALIGNENLYVRRFATGYFSKVYDALGFKAGLGDINDFSLGIVYPWEMRSGIGHVAGTLGMVPVESRGSRGVLVGSTARSARDGLFRHHFHLPVKDAPKPPHPFPGILRTGSKGAGVRTLQSRLHHLKWKALAIDGEFGPDTLAAVRSFQKSKGLQVDGVVGPLTWKALW